MTDTTTPSMREGLIIFPCPFCGGNAECHDDEINSIPDGYIHTQTIYLVTCGTDFCYGNAYRLDNQFTSRKLAIEAWNTRVSHSSELEAKIAELQKDADRYRFIRDNDFTDKYSEYVTCWLNDLPVNPFDITVDAAIAEEGVK